MIEPDIMRVADAVMYEGAFLYPYRKSSLKNRYRFMFGVLPPHRPGAQPAGLTAACLLHAAGRADVQVLLRCFTDDGQQVTAREVWARADNEVERVELELGGVSGALVLERSALGHGYERLRACVENRMQLAATEPREAERELSLHGVHLLLQVDAAACFVSLTEPPEEAEPYAALCEGQGLWCTLLGSERLRPRIALAAPVILPDFPQVAPESVTDLGDGTEIDEMLSLRIRTLLPEEKREARESDPWVRRMLDRIEGLSEQELLSLHGARRGADTPHALRGARVRLAPRRCADGMDILLAGRVAVVRQIEQSVDGEVLLGVTLEDDPGSDLGEQGLPGHRFFFGLDEVSLLEEGVAAP